MDRTADFRQVSPDYGFRGGIYVGSFEGCLWGDNIIPGVMSGSCVPSWSCFFRVVSVWFVGNVYCTVEASWWLVAEI
jgi:hypothetical protein